MNLKPYAFVLRSRAACHLPKDQHIRVTICRGDLTFLRVVYASEYVDGNPTYLRAYVECQSEFFENAVSEFGTMVGEDLQHYAMASNSMVISQKANRFAHGPGARPE